MKWQADIELQKRISNRSKTRPKTEREKDYLAKKKLRTQEVLDHHIQAQQKFKDPSTTQTHL